MEVTQYHVDQAESFHRLRNKSPADLAKLRAHFVKILPLGQNRFNVRDTRAIIAAIDRITGAA